MGDLLSVVINYKTPDLLNNFVNSYQQYVASPQRGLVVGNVCDDGKLQVDNCLGFLGWEENIGYARAVNQLVKTYSWDFDYIGIFNADTEFIDSNCVASCLDLLECNDDIGIVGPKQVNRKGQITHAGFFPEERAWKAVDTGLYDDILDATYVSGSAIFIKTNVWNELANDKAYKLLDPTSTGAMLTTNLFFEDTFLCHHARHKGYRVMYNGEACMIHHHNSSPPSVLKDEVKASRTKFKSTCKELGIAHDF